MSENHGKVWWSELATRDVEKAKAYYADVAGYSFDTMDMGEEGGMYHIGMLGEVPMVGIFDIDTMPGMDGVPPHWLTYIAVSDVDEAAKTTTKHGGSINRAPWNVTGVGRIAIVTDPGGAVIGLMTPDS